MSLTPPLKANASNIALLIDGDNAQPSLLEKMLLEITRYGRPTIRRIYGDWTTPNMNGWKSSLHDHAITPVQQFRNTVGKNATDSALIIDAMDILYSNSVRCFCIVSSDSDFTRLAMRIREEGIKVIGIGRENTPRAFVKACDVFIHTENLTDDHDEKVNPAVSAASPKVATKESKTTTGPVKAEAKKTTTTSVKKGKSLPPVNMLKKAFTMSVQNDGWASLGVMGQKLLDIDPAFDPRTWGYAQLSQLVAAASSHFTIKKTGAPGSTGPFVSLKTPKSKE